MRFFIEFVAAIAWHAHAHAAAAAAAVMPKFAGQRRHRGGSSTRHRMLQSSTEDNVSAMATCTADGRLIVPNHTGYYHEEAFDVQCAYCQNYNGWDVIPVPSGINPVEAEAFRKQVWAELDGDFRARSLYNLSCSNQCVTCYDIYWDRNDMPTETYCGIAKTKRFSIVPPLDASSWSSEAATAIDNTEFLNAVSNQFAYYASSFGEVCFTYDTNGMEPGTICFGSNMYGSGVDNNCYIDYNGVRCNTCRLYDSDLGTCIAADCSNVLAANGSSYVAVPMDTCMSSSTPPYNGTTSNYNPFVGPFRFVQTIYYHNSYGVAFNATVRDCPNNRNGATSGSSPPRPNVTTPSGGRGLAAIHAWAGGGGWCTVVAGMVSVAAAIFL